MDIAISNWDTSSEGHFMDLDMMVIGIDDGMSLGYVLCVNRARDFVFFFACIDFARALSTSFERQLARLHALCSDLCLAPGSHCGKEPLWSEGDFKA